MNCTSEEDISTEDAISFIHTFTQDSFLEENEPDTAKALNMIHTALTQTAQEIVLLEPSEKDKNNKKIKEEKQIEEINQDTPKKHRRHHSKTPQED